MIKEIMLASTLAFTPNTCIRRLNQETFETNQVAYAERFSMSLTNTQTFTYGLYMPENSLGETYFDFDLRINTSVDRTNNLLRYSFYFYNLYNENGGYLLNNSLVDISEDIDDYYFYISYEEYIENGLNINLASDGGTWCLMDNEYNYYSDTYYMEELLDCYVWLPNIFYNNFATYYVNLANSSGGNAEIERLEEIIEDLELEISTLENANRVLQDANTSLTQNNTDLQNQIIILNQYKTQLENQVNTLQTNYNEIYSLYENLLIENDELILQNEQLRLENEQLNTKFIFNNTFDLLAKAVESVSSFLNLEIAPNITIGMVITIPIIVAVVLFVLKGLIQ